MDRKKSKIIATIISLGLVVLLLSNVSLKNVLTTISEIDVKFLVFGFFLYLFSYYFRSLRFYLLLNKSVGINDLMHIVSVHQLASNILPAKLGEFTYVFLLKNTHKKTIGESTATLTVARLMDILSISILFFFSITMMKNLPGFIIDALWLISLFDLFIIVILLILLFSGRKLLEQLRKVTNKYGAAKFKTVEFFLRKSTEAVNSLEKVNKISTIILCFLFSLLIWIFNYSMLSILFTAMNIEFSFAKAILAASFMLFASLLPIRGIGGFGTSEAFWTMILVPLGLSFESSVIFGFSYHIILTLYYLIIGGLGFLFLTRKYGHEVVVFKK